MIRGTIYKRKVKPVVAKGHSKTKYRESMCLEIINMFHEGMTRSQFCARYTISECTFSMWLDCQPLFNDAYIVAHEKARAYYDSLAMNYIVEEKDGARLNTKLYELVTRNRFSMPSTRFVKVQGLSARTPEEKIDAICRAVESGQLTPDEAQKLSTLIGAAVNAEQLGELKNKVEQIEQAQKIGVSNDGFEEVKESDII